MDTLVSCFLASVTAALSIYLAYPLAARWGLVDKPGGRKQHCSPTPLIGGIAIFIGFVLACCLVPQDIEWLNCLLLGSGMLLVVGAIDDRFNLPVRIRFAIHALVGLMMIYWGNNQIVDLGSLFVSPPVALGWVGVPLTLVAVIGGINAVNMSDGVDGLSSGLALITLSFMAFIAWLAGMQDAASVMLILSAAIAVFWLFNFRFPGRSRASIFMGDAGTNFLGFIIAWFLVQLSQGEHRAMAPVVALWIFAIPLMDTASVMTRRILRKRSPFAADRSHLHHLLLDHGFSIRQTVLMIYAAAAMMGGIGLVAYHAGVKEQWLLLGFLALFAVFLALSHRFSPRSVPRPNLEQTLIIGDDGV